jgi:hypothetical protein
MMTEMFKPTILSQSERRRISKFEIPLKLSKADLKTTEALWQIRLEKSADTPSLGRLHFKLAQASTSPSGRVSLKIKANNHIYYVIFSSDRWLEGLSTSFEDGFRLSDHNEIAALALEAQFLTALTAIEKHLGVSLSFLELSMPAQLEQNVELLPGASFHLNSDKWGASEISLIPTSDDASNKLIKLLAHYGHKASETIDTYKTVRLGASLVASAAQITHDQLSKLGPGDGFMLKKNWVETSTLNLVVTNKVIATITSKDTGFEVDEVFAAKPSKQPATPLPSARRARRQGNESNT